MNDTITIQEVRKDLPGFFKLLAEGKRLTVISHSKPLVTVVSTEVAKPDYAIKLGDLRDKGWTIKMKNFEMTDEEFLAS